MSGTAAARADSRLRPEDMAELLRQGIRENVLGPGQQLVQEDLAKRFGVSRNPVREALRMLAAEGLVTIAAGDGAVVRTLTEADLDELYELRLGIEPALAPRIVDRARGADLDSLRNLAEALDQPQDIDVWLRDNYRFHMSLFRLAERPHTEKILASLLTLVQPYSLINVEHLGGRQKASKDHLEMVEAVRRRDADALASLFRDHLSDARTRLLEARVPATVPDALHVLRDLGR